MAEANKKSAKAGQLDDRFRETGMFGTDRLLMDSSFAVGRRRIGIMARWQQAVELAMS
jgi:hypothetical protein